jgi:hypothetical protein
MDKQDLIDLINNHGLQELTVESYVDPDDQTASAILRLLLKNGQELLLETDLRVSLQVSPLRIWESQGGDLIEVGVLETEREY